MVVSRAGLSVDSSTRTAICRSKSVVVSPREAELLTALLASEGRILSREEIAERVWGDHAVALRSVDACVCRLRKKLERIGHPGIATIIRRGYRLPEA